MIDLYRIGLGMAIMLGFCALAVGGGIVIQALHEKFRAKYPKKIVFGKSTFEKVFEKVLAVACIAFTLLFAYTIGLTFIPN